MYLVYRFEGYDNESCLALQCMISASASTVTFSRPKDFDFKQFDNNGRFGYGVERGFASVSGSRKKPGFMSWSARCRLTSK